MSLASRWPWIRSGNRIGEEAGESPAKYLDDVYRYARARLKSRGDAEDLACEVVQSLPERCEREDLRIYMLGMARRKVADRLRKRKTTVDLRDVDAVERFDDSSDLATMVGQVLGSLSDDQREALALKYVVGLSSAEIAVVLARSSEAVDSLLQRGRAAFAKEWGFLSSEESIR